MTRSYDDAIKMADDGIKQTLVVKTRELNNGKIMIEVENEYWDAFYEAFWDGKKLTARSGDDEAKRVGRILKAFGISLSNIKAGINMRKKLEGLW